MPEIFDYGTFWFWALLVFAINVELIFNRLESGTGMTGTTLVYGAILQILGDIHPYTWIWHHPLDMIGILSAILIVGIFWARYRWRVRCRNRFEKVRLDMIAWLRQHGSSTDTVPPELEAEFLCMCRSEYGVREDTKHWDIRDPLVVGRHKRWIIQKIVFWPIDALWASTHDALWNMGSAIYYFIGRRLQSDSDRIFESLKD